MKYKQGDILTYNNNRYRKILGVCGEVYFMSYISDDVEGENLNKYLDSYTEYDLDKNGYKLYTPPEEMLEPIEEPLKVRKYTYDYIKKNISHNGLVSMVSEFHQHNNYNVTPDEMIEFCQALKAYPNIEPEQQQLYYVKIVDNGNYSYYLRKSKDLRHLATGLLNDYVSYQYKYQFTRKEVEEISKKESKDYTPFMIKVEEN